MKKQVKKILAMFLVVMLFLFEIGSISAGATPSSVQEDSTGYTTTTWDFSDEAQLTDDFNGPWKRNGETASEGEGTDFAVADGYLYGATSTASDVRRVVLKKEYDVKKASVDVVPVEGVYYGGIMLGITGEKSGGSTANPSIMIELDDPNAAATVCTLRVRGYALNTTTNKIAETVIAAKDMTKELSSDKEAQAVNLKVEISGTNLVITVTPLSGTTTPYQCTLDITDANTDTTVFTSESLQGKVGLVARATATSLDNFSIACTDRTYDFSDEAQLTDDFNGPWKRNSDGIDFAVNGGYLYGATSTASDVRRVVLKKAYDVKTASVDVVPVEGVYCGGIMLGITNEKSGGSTANPSIMIEVDDPNKEAAVCTLRVRGYALNTTTNKIAETVIAAIDMTEALSSDKEAQAVNLKVEISGTNLVITVTPLSGTTTPYQYTLDITGANTDTTVFTSESLQGKVGLVARVTATNLDNFYFDYDLPDTADDASLTIGGKENSTITVEVPENRSLPTGADVVDGKYIIDWTMTTEKDGEVVAENVVDTYYGASCGDLEYTYEANVVDPAMLAVCSQEGASEKGAGYYDVRFMASLNDFDYEDYECAGFVLSKKDGTALVAGAEGYLTTTTTKLYAELYAGGELVKPADLTTYQGSNDYSEYFIAHAITGIPNNSTIYVRAYVKLANGDIVYGQTQTVEVPYTAQ